MQTPHKQSNRQEPPKEPRTSVDVHPTQVANQTSERIRCHLNISLGTLRRSHIGDSKLSQDMSFGSKEVGSGKQIGDYLGLSFMIGVESHLKAAQGGGVLSRKI